MWLRTCKSLLKQMEMCTVCKVESRIITSSFSQISLFSLRQRDKADQSHFGARQNHPAMLDCSTGCRTWCQSGKPAKVDFIEVRLLYGQCLCPFMFSDYQFSLMPCSAFVTGTNASSTSIIATKTSDSPITITDTTTSTTTTSTPPSLICPDANSSAYTATNKPPPVNGHGKFPAQRFLSRSSAS